MNNYAQDIKHFRHMINDNAKTVSCWAPFQAMHVDKLGYCGPCPFSFKYTPTPFKWGIDNSLLDIWNSNILEDLRTEYALGGIDSVNCRHCNESRKAGKPPSSLDYDTVGGKLSLDHAYTKEIELELSNKCNYMCNACSPWCSSKHMERMGLQNDPKYQSIFDDPKTSKAFVEDLRTIIHHLHRINFTGGEPFAQRIVYDILKMINKEDPKDLNIHFTTNGSVMNGMVKKLAARPNTHFTVSLDSIDPIKYPLIRVYGVLDNVMQNIDTIQSLCTGIIGCSFVVQKDNVYDLPKIVSWCNKRGIEFTYHIMFRMGVVQAADIEPIRVEGQSDEYLNTLKKYLLSAEIYKEDNELCDKNIDMFHQYIKRIK